MEEILAQPFDIQRHKAAKYLELELMIHPNGDMVYAIPSHQEFLIQKAMELHGWTREQLMDACPREFYLDFMQWLIPTAGGWIPVWPIGILNYPLTHKQVAALRRLKMSGLYRGYIPPAKKAREAAAT